MGLQLSYQAWVRSDKRRMGKSMQCGEKRQILWIRAQREKMSTGRRHRRCWSHWNRCKHHLPTEMQLASWDNPLLRRNVPDITRALYTFGPGCRSILSKGNCTQAIDTLWDIGAQQFLPIYSVSPWPWKTSSHYNQELHTSSQVLPRGWYCPSWELPQVYSLSLDVFGCVFPPLLPNFMCFLWKLWASLWENRFFSQIHRMGI